MRLFERQMGRHEVVHHFRKKRPCNEGACRRVEAVNDRHRMVGSGAQDDTGEASEFKTADLGKDIDAVTSIRLVHVERLLHDLHLVTETFIGNVCPASCDLDRIPVIKGP